jgi:dipeptidyl-peptidase-4
LTTGNTNAYTELNTVRYPKAGDGNPKVALLVYDLESKETKRLPIEGDPEQYLYRIRFAPSGKELIVNRTNRRQNALDVLAVDVETGAVRTVVREVQETFQNNAPTMQFLTDGKRFVWETERNGFKHFELRDFNGELINPLSKAGNYPCEDIVLIDEKAGYFYYTAYSDENPYNQQLHRVKLDGSGHRQLTSKPLNHTGFHISPRHNFFVAESQAVDTPPAFALYNADGQELAVLASGDWSEALKAGFSKPELFHFTADDGATEIYGILYKPANFDEKKKYPLLVDVYGGPQSRGVTNRFQPVSPPTELGFVVVSIGNRGTIGRGKAFEVATYKKLGGPDIQDQADGVKFIRQRPYVDGNRVGIFGHSYGGYMSALAVLKYPDVFHVAVAGAPVTDWRNYDTIYTERYMQTPQENSEGYQNGSCLNYVDNFKGKLLLVHGLIDDNVHPANTWQLSEKLHAADKRFDMMIYPNFKHGVGSTYNALRWEYFIEHLQPESGN